MSNVVEKWEVTGLLEGLGDDAHNCAEKLEDMANFILSERFKQVIHNQSTRQTLAEVLIPLARLTYKYDNLSPEELLSSYVKFLKKSYTDISSKDHTLSAIRMYCEELESNKRIK
jgi:hypothetical protein